MSYFMLLIGTLEKLWTLLLSYREEMKKPFLVKLSGSFVTAPQKELQWVTSAHCLTLTWSLSLTWSFLISLSLLRMSLCSQHGTPPWLSSLSSVLFSPLELLCWWSWPASSVTCEYNGRHTLHMVCWCLLFFSALHDKRGQLLADVFYGGGGVSLAEGLPRDFSDMEMQMQGWEYFLWFHTIFNNSFLCML